MTPRSRRRAAKSRRHARRRRRRLIALHGSLAQIAANAARATATGGTFELSVGDGRRMGRMRVGRVRPV